MNQEKTKKYKYYVLICLGFLMFGFISYFTYSLVKKEKLVSSSGPVIQNSKIYEENIEKNVLQEGFEYSDPSVTKDVLIPSSKSTSQEISTLKLTKIDDEKMGSGIVTNFTADLYSDQLYQVNIPLELYSSLAFKWNNGDIYVGNTKDSIKRVETDDEPFNSSFTFLSNLQYDLNKTFYIKTSDNTDLAIDIFNSISPKVTSGIAFTSEIDNAKSGAKYTTLPMKTRNEWGASTNLWDPYSSSDIDNPSRFTWYPGYYRASRFVIHHTASPNTADDPSRAVRDIYLYHAYSRGWGDIGYNFLIDQWGNIYEGKAGGDEVYSYHAYTEANTMSISISLIGNLHTTSPTSAQKDALKKLLAEKSVFYEIPLTYNDASLTSWLSTKITVFGHNDSYFWCYPGHPLDYNCPSSSKWVRNNTACPGQYLEAVLGSEIIPSASAYANSYQTFNEIKDAVKRTDQILYNVSQRDKEFIVEYNFPKNIDSSTIASKIPKFSGIVDYTIIGNKVVIEVGDWDDGVLVPYYGWTGYGPNTFFPASEGHIDRMRTLIKIFLLDPEVKNVGLKQEYKISPIE